MVEKSPRFSSCSSDRPANWLYLAIRSDLEAEPVLICSANLELLPISNRESSVSPICWTLQQLIQLCGTRLTAFSRFQWGCQFGLPWIKIEFADFSSIPSFRNLTLVTKRSSPLICHTDLPILAVSIAHPLPSLLHNHLQCYQQGIFQKAQPK